MIEGRDGISLDARRSCEVVEVQRDRRPRMHICGRGSTCTVV